MILRVWGMSESGQWEGASSWRWLDRPIAPVVLREILDGGQTFRWFHQLESGEWHGSWGRCSAALRLTEDGIEARPGPGTGFVEIQRYWADSNHFRELEDRLPWRGDPVLASAMRAFSGLRILRQPLGETLLAFLLSSTKPIAQIKILLDRLARHFGQNLGNGLRALPTWEDLARVEEGDLRRLGLGYRARYIHAIARSPDVHGAGLEEALAGRSYPEARDRLIALPGVGRKIADCVLLFGAGRLEAFPMDTWIRRALEEKYELSGFSAAQLLHFAEIHFQPAPGLAQQYLFSWIRDQER